MMTWFLMRYFQTTWICICDFINKDA